MTMLFYRLQ